MIDSYFSIEEVSEGEYKEKGSKFLAYAYPFDHEDQLSVRLAEIHDLHPKARHYCYAYKVGIDGNNFRFNDDGEPSGTAGRPILGQIESQEITNTLVIVVRYFGGTKLGVPGLIHAYKEAAHCALTKCTKVQKFLYQTFDVTSDFDLVGPLMNIFNKLPIIISEQSYDDMCHFIIQVRKSMAEETIKRLKGELLNRPFTDIQDDDIVPGLHINSISSE